MKAIAFPATCLAIAIALAGCAMSPTPMATTTSTTTVGADGTPAYVTTAMTDPGRSADQQRDARRHGAELVAFAGVKPGDRVLELVPSSGYFTRIFSKVVGPNGRVYAGVPQEMETSHPGAESLRAMAHAGYDNVDVLVQPAAGLSAPAPVDVVFTSQNYHDYPDPFMGPTDPMLLDKAVYAALKPGGTYVVIDHVAEAGSGLRDTNTLHRIDPAMVKSQVLAAGFDYVGESNVLRNPADTHSLKVFDPAIRGMTDQFAYKFRKPLHPR